MLSVILANQGMLIAMWVVLIAVGLEILITLLTALRGAVNLEDLAKSVTLPVLMDIFPLILLSLLTALDSTNFLILIWYYVAAVLVIIRVLMHLSRLLKK